MMAAPLIAGTDLRAASRATLAIYGNRDVIRVDQDPLGAQARVLATDGAHWTLVKPLADGARAVLFFNDSPVGVVQQAPLAALGLAAVPRSGHRAPARRPRLVVRALDL